MDVGAEKDHSLWPRQRLVETGAEGARDEDIDRVVQMRKAEQRRQDISCERKAEV
jgi:hypothetical protein